MRRALWLVSAAVPAVLLVLFLRVFVVGLYVVPSASMEPTILPGDLVVGDRVVPALGEVRAGDVVTFESPEGGGATLVKRVVAVGDQEVDVRGDRLFVDGVALDEPYAVGRTEPLRGFRVSYPYVVAEGCAWVMGGQPRVVSRLARLRRRAPVLGILARPAEVLASLARRVDWVS